MKRRKEGGQDGFEAWGGYMNAKKTKLQEQFLEEAANLPDFRKLSTIFQGVSIFVNGYSEPPAEVLRRIMLQHSGVFHDYQVAETTHVIASNLPNSKLQQKSFSKVIRPEWVVDSVAAGKLLPTTDYLLCARPALQPALSFKAQEAKKPAKNATDSAFLGEFYNNSRLHHLSTQGALLKQYVGTLKDKHTGTFPGIQRLISHKDAQLDPFNSPSQKVIMHIDMDCFFVSVAVRDRPELAGRPVAVTHARGNPTHTRPGADVNVERALYAARAGVPQQRIESKAGTSRQDPPQSLSEIASCSYEARAQGVRNGMYLGRALALCPGLITVPYDFPSYTEVSFALYDTVVEYTLNVEAVSCDELYVDCTSALKTAGVSVDTLVRALRADVTGRTRCPCSAGLGPNKLIARLASKKAKPNGQYEVQKEDIAAFMRDVSVDDLPGVGWSTADKLKQLDVTTCMDLAMIPLKTLKTQLGEKTGETLYRYCRGQDDRPVVTEHERKSVSAEVNYGIRFCSDEDAVQFLKRLSAEVSDRLKSIGARGKCVTLKLMIRSPDAPVETAKFMGHGVCDTSSKSAMLATSTNDAEVIADAILKLNADMAFPPSEMRGIGIQITKLDGAAKPGSLHSFLAKHSKIVAEKKEENIHTSPDNNRKTENKQSTISAEPKSCQHDIAVETDNLAASSNEKVSETHKMTVSPIKKLSKNVSKNEPIRKRGRKPMTNQEKSQITLKQFLQKSPKKVACVTEERPGLPPMSQLDPEVLNALPDCIKSELLAQYGVHSLEQFSSMQSEQRSEHMGSSKHASVPLSPVAGCSKFSDATNLEKEQLVTIEDTDSRDSTSTDRGKSLFAGLAWQELRELIELWVDQERCPENVDVDMLASHLLGMVYKRRLEPLSTLLTCLWRCIRTYRHGQPPWECAYQIVVGKVQAAMVHIYASPLRIPPL